MDRSPAGSVFRLSLPDAAYRGTAEISVYVNEKFRRRGVGRALIEKAIAHSPGLEINALVGCIFGHNEPSLRLFERLGFERWGFLPRIARVDEVERDLVIVGRHIRLLTNDRRGAVSSRAAQTARDLTIGQPLSRYMTRHVDQALSLLEAQLHGEVPRRLRGSG